MPQPTSKPAPRQPGYCRHGDRAYTRIEGQWFHLGKYGTSDSKDAYDQLIGQWLANGRRLVKAAPEPPGPTIAQILLGYYEHAEQKYGRRRNAAKTLSHIRMALRRIRQLYADTPAASFGPKALQAVRQAYLTDGLSRTTVNDRVRIVKDVFSWAVRQELVPPGLCHGLGEVRGLQAYETDAPEPRKVRPVPEEHVEAVRPHISRQVWAMIELQRLTGMRPGEVVIMRGCDLEMTGELWTYRPALHKMQHRGVDREVYIGKQGQEIIQPFLRRNLEECLFRPVDAEAERDAQRSKRRTTPRWPSHMRRNREKR